MTELSTTAAAAGVLGAGAVALPGRWRDRHSTGNPCLSLLRHLVKVYWHPPLCIPIETPSKGLLAPPLVCPY